MKNLMKLALTCGILLIGGIQATDYGDKPLSANFLSETEQRSINERAERKATELRQRKEAVFGEIYTPGNINIIQRPNSNLLTAKFTAIGIEFYKDIYNDFTLGPILGIGSILSNQNISDMLLQYNGGLLKLSNDILPEDIEQVNKMVNGATAIGCRAFDVDVTGLSKEKLDQLRASLEAYQEKFSPNGVRIKGLN